MRRILQNTFLAVALLMLPLLVVVLSAGATSGAAIVALLICLVCAPFPTYVAVVIYQYVIKKKLPNNKIYALVAGILLLLFIYHLGLLLYIAMLRPWSDILPTMSLEYTDEFGVPNVIGVFLAVAIPVADILIDKIALDMEKYKAELEKRGKR